MISTYLKIFLIPTNTDSEHPLLGTLSPRCSTAAKLRGKFYSTLHPWGSGCFRHHLTWWRSSGMVSGSTQQQSRSYVDCLGARQETPSVRWSSLLKKNYFLWGLGKRLTLVLLWIWCGWFTAVMSYPLPPVLFFCFSFFWHAEPETLRFCHTSGSTMPYCHPGGARENGWYGVCGEIAARTLWTWTSRMRLKAFDENTYSKLPRIFCHKPPKIWAHPEWNIYD